MSDTLKVIVGMAAFFVPGLQGLSYTWLIHLAGSLLISSAMAEDIPDNEGAEGALANQNSNKAQIPIIYGTRRLGGTRVFVGTHGTKNKFFDMVLVVSEGPIKGFRTVYLDDAICHFNDTSIPKWIAGTSRRNKNDDLIWTKTYDSPDIVRHEGIYWQAQTISHNTIPSSAVPSEWLEVLNASGVNMIDSAGSDVPWTEQEEGIVYLQVDDVTGFTASKYVTGDTSGATAQILSVDAGNDFLYIQGIVPNSITDRGFAGSEGLTETTNRNGTATGNTATGILPMKVVQPHYFKEDVTYTISGELLPSSSDKTNKATTEFKNLVEFRFHNGSTTQTNDTVLTTAQPTWTTNHRLRGKAYIYARFEYNKDHMTGVPNLTALADGNLVYDPRDLTTKFESNPALCIRDYLTNTYYGRGVDANSLDDNSFISAANYCDETLTVTDTEFEGTPSGSILYEGDRYNCNARLNTGDTILENTKQLLLSMRGHLVFSQGLYKIVPDKETSSYHTFDERNIIGGLNIGLGNKRNTLNELRVSFPNPLKNWQTDDAVYFSDSIKTTLDNDLALIRSLSTQTITNYHQALYIALQELKQSRQQLTVSFKTGIHGLLVETGDVIRVRSLLYGWGTKTEMVDGETVNVYNTRTGADVEVHDTYASGVLLGDNTDPMYKEFRVLSVTLDSKLEVLITALEYDPTVYTTSPASIEDYTPNTNMSDSRVSLPPTNLIANEYLYISKNTAGFKVGLHLTWDTSESIWDQSYEISINEPYSAHVDGDAYSIGAIVFLGLNFYECNTAIAVGVSAIPGVSSDWTSITEADAISRFHVLGITDDRVFNIKDVQPGWHTVEVRTINVVGKRSDAIEISYDVQGLTAPPHNVQSLGLIVNNNLAVLTWDKATDLDVLISGSVQIKHTSITDLSSYSSDIALETLWQNSLVMTEGKSGATTQVFLTLKIGTYLVKFIDASGIESLVPAPVTNFIPPDGSFNFISSFSELTDYEISSFDGLTNDADPARGTSGLEKTSHDSADKLQFLTQVGNQAVIANTDSIALLPNIAYVIAPLEITATTDSIPLTATDSFIILANDIISQSTSMSLIPTDTTISSSLDVPATTDSISLTPTDSSILTFPLFAGTPLVTSASYYLHNALNFTSITDAALSLDTTLNTYDVTKLVSSWTDIDTLPSIDGDVVSSDLLTKLSITQDDPEDLEATWSDYFAFLSGSIKCRGARALLEVSVTTPNTQVLIEDIEFIFDGKERTEAVANLQWTTADYIVGYKDVWFIQPFFDGGGLLGADPSFPIVSVTLSGGGLSYTISNGTQIYEGGPGTNGPIEYSGFRLIVSSFSAFNITSLPVNANVDFSYQATGY